MTGADLIALALLDAGITGQGQASSGEDTTNALRRLNYMISTWARQRWLVYRLLDVVCTSTGAQDYTIGPGMQFDTVRPDRIESAFARQLLPSQGNPIDYPLRIIQSREDYNLIAMKTLGTWPALVFYDSGWPTGVIKVWPLPAAAQFAIHLSVKQPFSQISDLTAAIALPPEYEAALLSNLVVRLCSAYKLPLDPVQVGLAKETLNVVRGANAQIATLRMPSAVVGGGHRYNVYSDS
jgi:hypothetical protein